MKKIGLLGILLILNLLAIGQSRHDWKDDRATPNKKDKDKREFRRNSNGLLIGYERGIYDNIQIGSEFQWRTVRIKKPTIRALDTYVEYNFGQNVAGIKTSYWQRSGRLKMTYGGKAGINTDFESAGFSLSPTIGFRLLGFHAQAGYNIFLNKPEFETNKLYISLNYFIPYHTQMFSKKGEKKKTIFKF